jgi:hypothetical protein
MAARSAAVSGTLQHDWEMEAPLGANRGREVVYIDTENLTTRKQDGAQRLVLGACGYALPDREMGQVIAHRRRVDARIGSRLLGRRMVEEPSRPVHVADFRAVGVVASAQPRAH